MNNVNDCLRYAEDYANSADVYLGKNLYKVFVTTITNTELSFDDNAAGVRTDTRLTIANGYNVNVQLPDGYFYPALRQENGQQLFFSAGQLTVNTFVLGPLVLPYSVNNVIGGTDMSVFQPTITTNMNLWVWINGNGLTPGGLYYDVKEMWLHKMDNNLYSLRLAATSEQPDLPPTLVP